jgi:ABC-type bacteriocin/lantibiotic exporter with double-glycine peptidase domain
MPPKPYLAPPFYPAPLLGDPTANVLPIAGFYQVRDYTCGYASTLTVLRYYRRYTPEQEVYGQLGTNHHGTSQSSIIRVLRQQGIRASIRYDLNYELIRRCIDSNKLIIGYHHRLEHWVTVFGYAREPDRVFIADSYPGYRREHLWDAYGPKMGSFGIVCSPKPRPSKPNEAALALHAA